MSGAVCGKKVIDNYAILGAEAAAMQTGEFGSFLTQEAAALAVAAEGSCDSFMQTHEQIRGTEKEQVALDESFRACEYAKELRRMRDGFNMAPPTLGECCVAGMRLRAIRDEITGVFQELAMDVLLEHGFRVPRP